MSMMSWLKCRPVVDLFYNTALSYGLCVLVVPSVSNTKEQLLSLRVIKKFNCFNYIIKNVISRRLL